MSRCKPSTELTVQIAKLTLAAAGALDGASNDLAGHLLVRPYPGMPDGDGDAYINPEFFHEYQPPSSSTRSSAPTCRMCWRP